MTSRLLYSKSEGAPVGQIAEFATVLLRHDKELAPIGFLPRGTRGIVVFTHDAGAAYEVEFSKPFSTVLTLSPDDIEPLEPTGERTPPLPGGSS